MEGNPFEQDIPWSNWQSIGKLWFDMECDGMVDYVKKMYKPSKIDQVLNYYWIPFVYKNEYKKYLKYRIEPRHCQIVTDYFSVILRSEWYDTSDFDYGELQKEYNIKVPVAEPTGLELNVNYAEFLEKDRQHREALEKWTNTIQNEQIMSMQSMMKTMMEQMAELQKQIWNPNVLLSKKNTDDWQQPSWSDSARNAEWTNTTSNETIDQEATLQEDGETGMIEGDPDWWDDTNTEEPIQWDSERAKWPELIWGWEIDWHNTGWWHSAKQPFVIQNTRETDGENNNWNVKWVKKDRRNS